MQRTQKVKNQNGDIVTDTPSDDLVNPKKEKKRDQDRSNNSNTTAKDPHLGNRSSSIR